MRICQILVNLVDNAVKYTESGKVKISITASAISEDQCMLCLEVADTGSGIPLSHQKLIYEPFVQATENENYQQSGVGLGLPIVKQLTDLLGGEITFQSKLGSGSTFKVQLPLRISNHWRIDRAQTEQLRTGGAQKVQPSRPLHLLLAEDNLVNQRVVSMLLQKVGHTFDLAANGAEALNLCRSRDYDLILMDLQMPVMDGREAVACIRKLEIEQGKRHVPVVALTAHAQESDRQMLLESGMDAYLSKPFTATGLYSLLEQLAATL
jgi:CheY-like chemotaxis protein